MLLSVELIKKTLYLQLKIQIMSFKKLRNINSVAFYEAKLLGRSWFFCIFVIAVFAFGLSTILSFEKNFLSAVMIADFPSSYAYIFSLGLSILQSIVIIFLSADYLKRDKQLDTSEVFYVKSLSNAEYLLGKMVGTLMRFITIDIVLLSVVYVLGVHIVGLECSALDFLIYFVIIILPSIVFFIGTSTMFMLVIGNQAITFVLMLGLSATSLFFVSDLNYNIFDLFAYRLPLYKSNVIGFTNLDYIIPHRLIYLSFGISSILMAIFLFKRLPGSISRRYKWLVLSVMMYGVSSYFAYNYFLKTTTIDREREGMIALNDSYLAYPKLLVDDYEIDVQHLGYTITSKVYASGAITDDGDKLVFSLNSGLKLNSVLLEPHGDSLVFVRNRHIIELSLDRDYVEGDTISLVFAYDGAIDNNNMFIDVRDEIRALKNEKVFDMVQIDKKGAILHPEWVLLTPESYWYPRAGVTYTNTTANWFTEYFSSYKVNVKPLEGLIPVTQGEPTLLADSITYSFSSSTPYRAVSLAISDYVKMEFRSDTTKTFYGYIHKKNRHKLSSLDTLAEVIPTLLQPLLEDLEREMKFKYTLDRFTIVDVPEQVFCYPRDWTTSQELLQPEITFLPGGGMHQGNFYFNTRIKNLKRSVKMGWAKPMSDSAIIVNEFKGIKNMWKQKTITTSFDKKEMGAVEITSINSPYYMPSALFNANYNIYSEKHSWGARLIEQSLIDNFNKWYDWERSHTGLAKEEQALLLLAEDKAETYLSDPKYANLINSITSIMGNILIAESLEDMRFSDFYGKLDTMMQRFKYQNIEFETLLDSIGTISGSDIRAKLPITEDKLALTAFQIEKVERTKYTGEEEPMYGYEFEIKNISDAAGYANIIFYARDENPQLMVYLEANQTKRIVRCYNVERWNPRIYSMNSSNLPQMRLVTTEYQPDNTGISPKDGEYVISDIASAKEIEIIVDNEDEELFSVTQAPITGVLNKIIDARVENSFKYKAIRIRHPYRWTPVTDEKFYGKDILSAYIIKKGDGDQKASWKIPIEEKGTYAFYYTANYPHEVRWLKSRLKRNVKPVYNFTVDYGDEQIEIESNLTKNIWHRSRTETWVLLDEYNVKSDTVTITLSNKSDLTSITADAVKAVKVN